jgi:hypothetical protein
MSVFMQRTFWPSWVGAVALTGALLLVAGCQASEPLVPRFVYEKVNDDGREHTYDTAWQNIRKLNADLPDENSSSIAEDSLFIASQMDRLERGTAGSLGSSSVSTLMDAVSEEAAVRSEEENFRTIVAVSQALQDSFDAGDFAPARDYALEVHAIARFMATPR